MKRILGLLLVLVSALVLVGCGEKTTLTTVSMFGGTDPNGEVYREVIKEFEKETGWKVKDDSTTSSEEWKIQVREQFESGNEPDVLQFFTGADAKPFVDANKVVSIADIRKEYPNYAKNITPDILGTHSVPTTGFVEGLFVNKAHFKSNEAKAFLNKDRWTWAEFLELLAIIKNDNKDVAGYVNPISMGQDIPHYWLDHVMIANLGTDFDKKIRATGGDEVFADTLLKLNDIREFLTYESKEADATQGFKDGESTFLLDGSWAAGGLAGSKVENDIAVFPFPVINEEQGTVLLSGFTSGFYISKKAWENKDKREKAVKFVEMMTTTETLTKYAKVGGFAADNKATPAEISNINKALGDLRSKATFQTLPFGDLSVKSGYKILTDNQSVYFSGNRENTLARVKEYLAAKD